MPFSVQPAYESSSGLEFGLVLHQDLFLTIGLQLTNQHDSQVHIRHPMASRLWQPVPCLSTAQPTLETFHGLGFGLFMHLGEFQSF